MGAGGLVHVAKTGKGQVAYLAVRPEVFEVEWLPNRPKWQQTEVYWPTTKFCRIVATILANAGAGSAVSMDIKAAKRSDSV